MKCMLDFKESFHRFLTNNSNVILTYHSIVKSSLSFDLWTHMCFDDFLNQMEFLYKKCNVISLYELSENIIKKKSVKHGVVVTFDDGFANNYYNAYPVLKSLGLPATIFLTTGYIGKCSLLWPEHLAYLLMRTSELNFEFKEKSYLISSVEMRRQVYCHVRDHFKTLHPDQIINDLKILENSLKVSLNQDDPLFRELHLLDWQQVEEMEREGCVTFGGHTEKHTILSRLNQHEAYEQIRLCRETLDSHLGTPSRLWAYPNGRLCDFSHQHKDMLSKTGFDIIVTTEQEFITPKSKITEMGRWSIGGGIKMPQFRKVVYKCGWLDGLNPVNKLARIATHIFR